MAANLSFNPFITSVANGTFFTNSDGFVQGEMLPDPSILNWLTQGPLASTETLPMWGGVLLYENIPLSGQGSLGLTVGRATSLANATAFSVFNQANAWVTSPQSEAPSAGNGMTISYFRLGSRARIPVQCDPALVSLDGGLPTQNVSWDFVNQRLIPYYPVTGAIAFTAMTPSVAGGVVTISATTASAHNLSVGNDFTVAGVVPTAYNGSFTVLTAPTTTTLTYILTGATTSPGSVTTQGTLASGGGALNVRVLDTNIGSSKTITYDAVNNYVHYNPTGSVAIIEI